MILNETSEALRASMLPARSFNAIIIGIDPIMSITANKTMVTFKISTILNTIIGAHKINVKSLKANPEFYPINSIFMIRFFIFMLIQTYGEEI
jgi:hypothetical protein